MNLEDKKTKVILIVISAFFMLGFIVLDYKKKHPDNTYAQKVDYNNMENSNISRVKSGMMDQYKRDVQDYSFQRYMKDQKEGTMGENKKETLPPLSKEQPKEKEAPKTITKIVYVDKKKTNQLVHYPKALHIKDSNPSQKQDTEDSQPKDIINTQPHKPTRKRRLGFNDNQGARAKNVSCTTNIKASILETSKVKSGDIILLRTTDMGYVDNTLIPQNTIIEGTVGLNSNRLTIQINNIKIRDMSLACTLNAYDANGNQGIMLSSNVNYQVKNQTKKSLAKNAISETTDAVSSVPYLSILGNIASNMTSKKMSDPVITVYKGMKVYLKN